MTIKNGRIHSIRHGSLRHEALGLNKELKSMEKKVPQNKEMCFGIGLDS